MADKTTKYTVRVFNGMAQQTAYEGTSFLRSQEVIDLVRGVLILSGGSAIISVSRNDGPNDLVWTVQNGHARCNAVRVNPAAVDAAVKRRMNCTQQAAYNVGYSHGWNAPTEPYVANPHRYKSDADYKLHYDLGFQDGKDRKPISDSV